jgi:hypothetical protein
MASFTYNDLTFTLEPAGDRWDLRRGAALTAAGLFPGLDATEALAKARDLARMIHPVGVRSVGPDVTHPQRIGDLKIVGPDVTHPNFIRWNQDSVGAN